ncbi:SWIM zinc finger family protein [Amycolatopsis magusensis]|uniref:Zn finger protein n=1 Tax=Amycolatopsis magusensis TaxID=882444 RepID=A0ABS4PJ35_9PSEU|nr:SWIM zinc finger family protein [Amycolatopsis magusensis]MBP2179431.1 putative Zn finger protein [Amycolatopsis magusensis]
MTWFSEDELRSLAGNAVFQRGRGMVGKVEDLGGLVDGVTAVVVGSEPYRVGLKHRGGTIEARCTCPFAADGAVCKHAVAVGLAWLRGGKPVGDQAVVRKYIDELTKDELVDLVLNEAGRDASLLRRLSLRAMAKQTGTLSGRVDALEQEQAFLEDARDVLDLLEEELAENRDLIRRAVEVMAQVAPDIDDESGAAAAHLLRAIALYARACAVNRPDRQELASWIAGFEKTLPGWLQVRPFAEALEEDGLRHLVELAGDERKLREQAVEALGDVDELVNLLAEDPRVDHVRIAKALYDAGRVDEAIERAEHSMTELPATRCGELAEFLVSVHLEADRPDQASAVLERFLWRSPTKQAYDQLKELCERLGTWPEPRKRVLRVLRASARERQADQLIDVLLAEGEAAQAWDAAAEFGCSQSAWLRVADQVAEDRPAEVAGVYRLLATDCVKQASRDGYRQAVVLLKKLRRVHELLETDEEFDEYVDELRRDNERRPAFLDELRKAGL